MTFFLVGIGVIALIIVLVVIPILISRRNRSVVPLKLSEVGTIIDRSIASYRRNLLPLLVLSMLSMLLGNIAGSNLMILWLLNVMLPYDTGNTLTSIAEIVSTIGSYSILGIGQAVLACTIIHAIYTSASGTIRLADALPRERLRAVAGMVALLIVVSLLSRSIPVIGILIAVYCALAPVVLFYETLSPYAAIKRSIGIVRPQLSGIINVLVPLWVIGWLIAGAPLFGTLALLNQVTFLPPDLQYSMLLIAWVSGNVFVQPLLVLGALHFYLYMGERPADLSPPGAIARVGIAVLLVLFILFWIGFIGFAFL